MTVGRWVAGVLCLPLICLAGCTDDDSTADPDPTPSITTPTPTESQSPAEPVEPEPPAAMGGKDAKAAKAFVRYYWDVVNYAQQSGDVDVLRTLSSPACQQCKGGADWVKKVYRKGGRIIGGDYTVRVTSTTELGGGASDRAFEVTAVLQSAKQRVVGQSGRVLERYPAGRHSYTFSVGRADASWQLGHWETIS